MAKRESKQRAGRERAEAETAAEATETVALSDMPGMAMRLADDGTAAPAPVEPPVSTELKAIIEALVFASPEPLTAKALFKLLDTEPREEVERALASLKADYNPERGLQIVEIAGGLQIVTRTDLHEWVRRLFHERKSTKLSVQALETLAVVAYRQPVTAAEIAEIRGVNTSGVLATLMERKLVKIAGRKPVVGRPFLYATTREFLMRFGLNDLTDLPKVEDMADVLGFEIPGLGEAGPSEQFLPLEAPDESQAATAEPEDARPMDALPADEPMADEPPVDGPMADDPLPGDSTADDPEDPGDPPPVN